MRRMRILAIVASALLICLPASLWAQRGQQPANPDNILDWKGKTVMVFGAHPDDDLGPAGTMAKLVKNGNKVIVVIYTSGNKGSRDPDMTSERLAQIRKAEDIAANKILGIPEQNIIFLGYDDGYLEYVPQKELAEKVCRLIRLYRPDAVFGHDPGDKYVTWHKTDHRMAAMITVDGARAAAYHLYFPHHRLYEGLQPHTVRDWFFRGGETNYKVDVTDVVDLKIEAGLQHVSQFGKGNLKYTGPTIDPADREARKKRVSREADGKVYESFRRERGSLSF